MPAVPGAGFGNRSQKPLVGGTWVPRVVIKPGHGGGESRGGESTSTGGALPPLGQTQSSFGVSTHGNGWMGNKDATKTR